VITVTGLSGDAMVVNVDQIIRIEQTPDTVITFLNGDKLIVRESLDELVDRTVAYRRRGSMPAAAPAAHAQEENHGG